MKSENECMCDISQRYKPAEVITTVPPTEVTPEEEVEWVVDETTNSDRISSAWYANDVFEGYDPMGDRKGSKMKNEVQRMCRDIIHKCISEMHEDLFTVDE